MFVFICVCVCTLGTFSHHFLSLIAPHHHLTSPSLSVFLNKARLLTPLIYPCMYKRDSLLSPDVMYASLVCLDYRTEGWASGKTAEQLALLRPECLACGAALLPTAFVLIDFTIMCCWQFRHRKGNDASVLCEKQKDHHDYGLSSEIIVPRRLLNRVKIMILHWESFLRIRLLWGK